MSIELEKFDPDGLLLKLPAWYATVVSVMGSVPNPSLGGIPGVNKNSISSGVKRKLDSEAKKPGGKLKEVLIKLLVLAGTAAVYNNIPALKNMNKTIKTANTGIGLLDTILTVLEAFIKTLFPIIIALTIVYIAAKIVGLIPAITIGFGGGVAFTAHIAIAGAIASVCEAVLTVLVPIAFAVCAIMLWLLSLFALFNLLSGLLLSQASQNAKLANACASDSLKTASDWATTSTIQEDVNKSNSNLSRDKLNDDGSKQSKSDRLQLMMQINDIDYQVNQLNSLDDRERFGGLIDCTLPDGSVEQMTFKECFNATGAPIDGGGFWSLKSGTGDSGEPTGIPPTTLPPQSGWKTPYNTGDDNSMWEYRGLGDGVGGGTGGDGDGDGLTDCTLPNGLIQKLTPSACLTIGGMYGGLIACALPDGTIVQTTPEACLAMNGGFGDDLVNTRGDIEEELNNLGGPLSDNEILSTGDGSGLIITSLLNLHDDITVRRVTNTKGKRIGFYQSDINE